MCGIAGIVELKPHTGLRGLSARMRLDRMLNTLQHRGPDDWAMGFWGLPSEASADEESRIYSYDSFELRVALGHRRLSILDLSSAGRQPMSNEDDTLWLIFNGEIYNYIELRQELKEYYSFTSGTDTEVLLAAYQHWGIDMLRQLDGMFAFALLDIPKQKLICARDAMGIKPFYYGIEQGYFVFGSEPRAVLVALDTSGHIDAAHIAEFLVLGTSDYDEGTSYREVKQLPGGCWFEISHGVVSEPRNFWSLPETILDDTPDIQRYVREQIDLAICRQLRSDVPVGSCLSGGVDSGVIISAIGRSLAPHADRFTAITLVGRNFVGDESALAGISAERAGVHWVKTEPSIDELSENIGHLVDTMGEPFTSLSMFGQNMVMRAAAQQGMKVMLDGQGADEVFLGYPRVAQRIVGEYVKRGNIRQAAREQLGFRQNASVSLKSSAMMSLYYSTAGLMTWRNTRRLTDSVSPDLLHQLRPEIIESARNRGGLVSTQINELRRFVLPRLLKYEDRNSMAYSIEARVPMLAVGLVNLGLQLPLRWRVRDGWTKYALRSSMQGLVPDEIIWSRRKLGFEVPQKRWVEAISPKLKDWLADLPPDSPIDGRNLLECIERGLGHQQWLWRCISVALWIRATGVSV